MTALAVGQAILSRRYWNLFVWMTTLSALAAALVALRYAGGSPAPPAATGDWNLADVLARTRSAGLGKLFLVVSVVAPVLSGLHSGTMALAAWPACRAGKRPCS